MPTAPLRPCPAPGCPALTSGGYCGTHRRTRNQRRGSAASRGYGAAWRAAREAFLLEYPLCGMRPNGRAPVLSQCHATGRRTPATVVDHVDPHRGDDTRFWDVTHNWQSLCGPCHQVKIGVGL